MSEPLNRGQIAGVFGGATVVAALLALAVDGGLARMLSVPGMEGRAGGGDALVAAGPEDTDAGGLEDELDAGMDGSLGARLPPRRISESEYRKAILDRNIFDQSAIGRDDGAPGGNGSGPEEDRKLNVQLVGTVVAVPESYSAAFILEEGKTHAYAFGIGQKVVGAEILLIEEDRVRVRRADGGEEWIRIDDERPDLDRPIASSDVPPSAVEEVEQIGEDQFVVSRQMVTEALSDMESLSRMARPLLHRGPDGEFDGYRLSAIRRGTLLDKLGVRNGDIVHSVNGMDLNSVQGAMQALEALESESKLEFKVTRRGEEKTLSYDLQ